VTSLHYVLYLNKKLQVSLVYDSYDAELSYFRRRYLYHSPSFFCGNNDHCSERLRKTTGRRARSINGCVQKRTLHDPNYRFVLFYIQGRSDGGISVYIPPNQCTLNFFMWLFCLLDPLYPPKSNSWLRLCLHQNYTVEIWGKAQREAARRRMSDIGVESAV